MVRWRTVFRGRLHLLVRGYLQQPRDRSDANTVRWEWEVPYFLFEDIMAGDTALGGGQAVRQAGKVSFGGYSPAHYLKQFLPKYSSVEAVNARAKQEGFENWV